ncbi:NAD-dependent succinate-semialdehyde dehydrogenase [Micromonospora sp. KC606]|uniref:NAD-dependent succinate-semialdehyde dehydrogenase n=1 Tax=Micromonospora sp. KC606 TaxID=2530379 RepID=UPI00104B5B16|nr:NAD-dependent succinate-semialdehyde dehydrogenase [Micromonospora sp. KC606]TDC83808.1 NAD-dependent succinate-semialdehyde dehydrogenase [Micromonospora sp. KC606]
MIPESVLTTVEALDPEHGVHIAGIGRAAASGETFDVWNPATETLLATFASGGAAEATAAVDAAEAAFAGWAATAPRDRGEILRRAFERMIARREELAGLISAENGKALADARAEVSYAAEFFRWFSEEAVRPEGGYGSSPTGGVRTVVTERPVGIAALATPWNFPAAMATRKIGPALAAGCSVVLKPASETPLTALAVTQILEEAGAPAGVVNLVVGSSSDAIVSTWLADPRVRKISFTGSTGVGRLLLTQAAARIVNSSMELGGNAPFVIAPDADIQAAVAGAMIAKFRNGGQACTAANRFYVHADVVDDFATRLGTAMKELRVGSAFEEGTTVGPMISAKAVAGLSAVVDEAIQQGAKVAYRAEAGTREGHFFPPTLLIEVPPDAAVVQNESFGPVAPVVTWTDEAELLAQVNGTALGLASYVYSGDLKWAMQFAERLEAGMVGINRGIVSDPSAPFGGVKQSGIGREGAREGIRAFTEVQYFSIDWS